MKQKDVEYGKYYQIHGKTVRVTNIFPDDIIDYVEIPEKPKEYRSTLAEFARMAKKEEAS